MADTTSVEVGNILQSISRHLNCLGEENRNTRKRAIEGIKREIFGPKYSPSEPILHAVLSEILKPLLKVVSDPVEKCRELSISFISVAFDKDSQFETFLPLIFPVLVQRLGQKDITEPSEEVRLQLIEFLYDIIVKTRKKIAPFLDDLVRILQRTIVDAYPEIKKKSCKCASEVAKCIPGYFHMQSESLIKPLLQSISHQHSRVRVEVVFAIGDVIQYGNGKSVDDVVSHLAQRLFDQAPAVRAAVIQIVGNWLLDLQDRYSFHHKLMPLLLTGLQDDLPDIREQADTLWHDVGLKYAGENEEDLKDKQDFLKADPEHYPSGIERPNIGCRTLMYRNFSKILSGITNDIGDWVMDTRVKSAGLLYQLIINEEENTTQHLEKILHCLYKGSSDESSIVVDYVTKSAELLGYFVSPEVWCKMALQQVKRAQNPGSLLVLAAIIRGSNVNQLSSYLHDVVNILSDGDICRIADSKMQLELLHCVGAVISVCGREVQAIALDVFTTLISVLAVQRAQEISDQAHKLLDSLSTAIQLNSTEELYSLYTKPLLGRLQDGYLYWTQHSVERLIFDTLLVESGAVVGELLEEVVPMLTANLNPDKDAEVRLKFFSLLSRLVMNAPNTLDSQNKFSEFAVVVVRDMILPNCVWRAGRVAGAIRTTAVSCLWAIVQSTVLPKEKLLEVVEDLITQLKSTLEDDNQNTRLVSCRVLNHVFRIVGTSLDQDRLHNMYPELLKRLDDSSDDIRVAMCNTFLSYFNCFQDNYEVSLYRAHLEAIYKGLLVHLDDPDQRIQEAVLEVLKLSSSLGPHLLMRELDEVKHKHRTTKYCDLIAQHIEKTPIKS